MGATFAIHLKPLHQVFLPLMRELLGWQICLTLGVLLSLMFDSIFPRRNWHSAQLPHHKGVSLCLSPPRPILTPHLLTSLR